MRSTLIATAVVLLNACAGEAEPQREGPTNNGTYSVYWDTIPNTIPFNETFKITAMIHDGEDTSEMFFDKELFVDATMPDHGHGMDTTPAVTMENGVYTVEGMLFHMAGFWELVFAVSDGETVERAIFDIQCCEQ